MALLSVLLLYTRAVYWRLARDVARHVEEQLEAGITVLGIVGIDGSPSCGVTRTLDVGRSLRSLGQLRDDATTADVNASVRRAVVEGEGLFVRALRRRFARMALTIPFGAHDLLRELDGVPQEFSIDAMRVEG